MVKVYHCLSQLALWGFNLAGDLDALLFEGANNVGVGHPDIITLVAPGDNGNPGFFCAGLRSPFSCLLIIARPRRA
jgi:hypothetical protein